MSKLMPLCAETIPLLGGGRCGAALNRAIRRAIADVDAKPGLPTARQIVLTLTISPGRLDEGRDLEDVGIGWKVAEREPALAYDPVPMAVRKTKTGMQVLFHAEFPGTHPEQEVMEFETKETRE